MMTFLVAHVTTISICFFILLKIHSNVQFIELTVYVLNVIPLKRNVKVYKLSNMDVYVLQKSIVSLKLCVSKSVFRFFAYLILTCGSFST